MLLMTWQKECIIQRAKPLGKLAVTMDQGIQMRQRVASLEVSCSWLIGSTSSGFIWNGRWQWKEGSAAQSWLEIWSVKQKYGLSDPATFSFSEQACSASQQNLFLAIPGSGRTGRTLEELLFQRSLSKVRVHSPVLYATYKPVWEIKTSPYF